MDGNLELAPLHDISACLAVNGKCCTLKLLLLFEAVVQKEMVEKLKTCFWCDWPLESAGANLAVPQCSVPLMVWTWYAASTQSRTSCSRWLELCKA